MRSGDPGCNAKHLEEDFIAESCWGQIFHQEYLNPGDNW